jgi:hypothetical protein
MSVKELQKELGTRHLDPIKTSETLLSPQRAKEDIVIHQIERPVQIQAPKPDTVSKEEYDRLKILYDDVKVDNDKKKNYIQELAGKYQGIIEDLKSQLSKSTTDDKSYQENLKLRKVIKKMDEEINSLKTRNSDYQDDLQQRINDLQSKNNQL